VVVYGRRRIGKSRLIEEFGKDKKFYAFSGIFPKKETTAEDQLHSFYQQFSMCVTKNKDFFTDWGQAFHELAKHTQNVEAVILLDEITWMGSRDPNFLGKLKNAWDMEFKKNPKLILVLCGSVSSWVEKNLITGKGFFGRISLKLKLLELTLPECNTFWGTNSGTISNYEKLKLLSVTGGIPKYLEEIDPSIPADDNINKLCFMRSGLLFNDYDYIFTSMLEHRSQLYKIIVEALCRHNLTHRELLIALNKKSGGLIADYIDELEISGFIAKDYTWNIKTKSYARFCNYRISDNYIRFYIKYILPNMHKVKAGKFNAVPMSSLPGWSSIMGFQIENLVIHNRDSLLKLIHVYPSDVVFDGPFFQRKTERIKGCQIDYLIQVKQGVLYLCEIKFSRSKLDTRIITEVKEKMNRIYVPNNVSIVPVLIHIGDISDDVIDNQFFGKIVNIGQFLTE
jgi:AAA+ ATPase superfamily predicted ATPase